MIAANNKVKVVSINDGVVVHLSPEVLAKLGVKNGDSLSVEATASDVRITPDRSALVLSIAERVMREDREVLRRLAE